MDQFFDLVTFLGQALLLNLIFLCQFQIQFKNVFKYVMKCLS